MITLVLGNSQPLASLIICFSTTLNEAHRVLQHEIQAECPKTVRARSLWHRWPNQTCLAGGTMPVGSGPNARGESFNMSSLSTYPTPQARSQRNRGRFIVLIHRICCPRGNIGHSRRNDKQYTSCARSLYRTPAQSLLICAHCIHCQKLVDSDATNHQHKSMPLHEQL